MAFLPWLFLVVEALYQAASGNFPFSRRLPWIAAGGLISAIAVYAGFPEEVYLYGLLLLLWAGYRLVALGGRARWIFLFDLGLVGVLGLLLSLPVLLAFAGYLPEAALGGHGLDGFYGAFLPPAAVLQYLSPYVFGPIFSVGMPEFQKLWGWIGGYIGIMPLVLALAALQLPERRKIKILLASWIIVALCVSQGVPGVYQAFMVLPMAKIAACYRYLNASWIFCFVILVGLLLDELPRTDPARARRALLAATASALMATLMAVVLAWPLLARAWTASAIVRNSATLSALFVSGLLALTVIAALRTRNRVDVRALITLLLFEAIVNFTIPYLSYPLDGRIDMEVVQFIRQNAGFQRVVGTESGVIDPNYGSYFGFSLLNWDDLPSPRLARDYVRDHLDPFIHADVLFVPAPPGLTDEQRMERRMLLARRLGNYARAGVKYVLSANDPAGLPALRQRGDSYFPLNLDAGQKFEMTLPGRSGDRLSIARVSVLAGTYGGRSDGQLRVELCGADDCSQGATELSTAVDNAPLEIALDRPVSVSSGERLRIVFEKNGGDHALALWMASLAEGQADIRVHHDGSPPRPGFAPIVEFVDSTAYRTRFAYRGKNFNVYELQGVRPYFDAPDCELTPISRDEVRADCPRSARLVRLELAMPGWAAVVDGNGAEIRTIDGAFQEIDLPMGLSLVRFVYMPAGMRASLWIAGAILILVLVVLGNAARKGLRNRRGEYCEGSLRADA